MIKQRQNQPLNNVVNFQQQPPKVQPPAARPGDLATVTASNYILKPVNTNGPLEVVMFAIAERLACAEKAGYRYIDRIPANNTESIMIFEKIK
jgi:hypothetical protein